MPINTETPQTTTPMHFWLRAETKIYERRTPLLPDQAKELIQMGHRVTVEEYDERCVPDAAYVAAGCTLVPTGSWIEAPSDAIILGLKELPVSNEPLRHHHVMFGHCFKNQEGSEQFLRRFKEGGGKLWDLEFLVDEQGKRVAAFGRSAGFLGMATGILQWCHATLTKQVLGSIQHYTTTESMLREVRDALTLVMEETSKTPKIMIMGGKGRCGGGAIALAKLVGIPSSHITSWGEEDTMSGGPFAEILDCDIFVNCIYLSQPIAPFLTASSIKLPRNLSVVVDVSCDLENPHNPLPIYTKKTNFRKPAQRISHDPILDVVSIDHLTSLAPLESSKEFSGDLLVHLKMCGNSAVWQRTNRMFEERLRNLTHDNSPAQ
eukprot:TRINITY_DN2302_c0_g1_i1.p1 TRINITY_DN2302_c0_g1~~TRINITY_DN2302_c0_g1_i1.p1  ORF type:complete len:377 (+),score=86.23 TRINITY_DN2302_c0_g1_i1:143-1273(+)